MSKKRTETGWTGVNDGFNNGWVMGATGNIKTVVDLIFILLQFSQDRNIYWQSEKNSGEINGVFCDSSDNSIYLHII
jgi:hypothetical protein